MSQLNAPLVLLILDGWGYRENPENNAILAAHTPILDELVQTYPNSLISGSGLDVGLPDGQMGNSEVGHVNLGAGRVVYQDFTKITKSIAEGDFNHNSALTEAIDKAVAQNKAVHIMGLLSPGGVHSHEEHIFAAIRLAVQRGAQHVYLHGFLDGRDTPPRSAKASLVQADAIFAELGVGRIASLVGRYYAMDRDNRWERVEEAYQLLTKGKGAYQASTAVEGLENAYARDENDEFVKATVIGESVTMADGDAVIFMNFRADRARQLAHTFVDDEFTGFARGDKIALSDFVMLTEYESNLKNPCAFPPEKLTNVLGEWLAKHNKTHCVFLKQKNLLMSRSSFQEDKDEFSGEQRVLIPSQMLPYDLQPEMNSVKLTDELVDAIKNKRHDVIICNFPNGDMVGHTGNFEAAVKAEPLIPRLVA